MVDNEEQKSENPGTDTTIRAEENGADNTDQLLQCRKELGQVRENYFRAIADFDNYRKRTEKERVRWIFSGQETLLVDLLSIIDEFDRALAEHQKKERTPAMEAWLQGFELIGKLMYKFLDKYEVKELENHHTFTPELHEALAQVDSADHEEGKIVQVMQKGFTFKDAVIRPAKVTVAK